MKKYLIDTEEYSENEFWSEFNDSCYKQAESTYDDYIDNVNESVKIFGSAYNPSQVLYEIDRAAYSLGLSEYRDTINSENRYNLENGFVVDLNDKSFKIIIMKDGDNII